MSNATIFKTYQEVPEESSGALIAVSILLPNLYSQFEGVSGVPGVRHLLLPEDLTVCVTAQILQRNAAWGIKFLKK